MLKHTPTVWDRTSTKLQIPCFSMGLPQYLKNVFPWNYGEDKKHVITICNDFRLPLCVFYEKVFMIR